MTKEGLPTSRTRSGRSPGGSLPIRRVGRTLRPRTYIPNDGLGQVVPLVADLRSAAALPGRGATRARASTCRRFPMHVWLFERFTGPDLTRMWRWLATHDVPADVDRTRSFHPPSPPSRSSSEVGPRRDAAASTGQRHGRARPRIHWDDTACGIPPLGGASADIRHIRSPRTSWRRGKGAGGRQC